MKPTTRPYRIGPMTLAGVALCGSALMLSAQPALHFSFDTPTITLDAGNITGVGDSTGNHNATPGSGVGSASVANGGPTFTSNPIPEGNSISGQFGQALTLNGNNNFAGGGGQFLMFPNLTELMTANGAPSYTVSYWINTTTLNGHNYTVLGDWGNAASNPGRFTYGFGFQFSSGNAQMRGQTRANITGTGNGIDIFARPVTTASLNDGNWHMLTWTFDTGTGELKSYFDAQLVDTFNSAAASFAMVNSSSAFGTIGFKGDSGNFVNGSYTIDELWIVRGVMQPGEIQTLFSVNVVPEPSTFALLGIGALAFGMFRRRN